MQGQRFPEIYEATKENPAHEDYPDRLTTDKINFHKKWTHSDTKVGCMLPLDDMIAEKKYKEMFKYFDREIPLEEAIRQIQSHTREYARKQLTWYKKDDKVRWFNLSDEKVTTDNITKEIISIIHLHEQENN